METAGILHRIDDQRIGLQLASGSPRHLIIDRDSFIQLYIDSLPVHEDGKKTEFIEFDGRVWSRTELYPIWAQCFVMGLTVSFRKGALEVTE